MIFSTKTRIILLLWGRIKMVIPESCDITSYGFFHKVSKENQLMGWQLF